MDAEWQTKKNRRQGKRAIEPLYRTRDAEESLRYLAPVELDQTIDLEPGSKVRLRNAVHILGSAIAELWVEDEGRK
jgi:metallo-beta-lactamase family protein